MKSSKHQHKCDDEVLDVLELKHHRCSKFGSRKRMAMANGEHLNTLFLQLFYDDIDIGLPFDTNKNDYNICNSLHSIMIRKIKTPEKNQTKTPTSRSHRHHRRIAARINEYDFTNRNLFVENLNNIPILPAPVHDVLTTDLSHNETVTYDISPTHFDIIEDEHSIFFKRAQSKTRLSLIRDSRFPNKEGGIFQKDGFF